MSLLVKEDSGRERYSRDLMYASQREWEKHCRRVAEDHFWRYPLIISSSSLPICELSPVHILDSCNKAVAIYWTAKPNRAPFSPDSNYAGPEEIFNVIYPQWWFVKGHNTDIEFGRNFAKLVRLDGPGIPSTDDVSITHQSLCDEIMKSKKTFEDEALLARARETSQLEVFGIYEADIDLQYHQEYRMRPLFRALLIIADDANQRSRKFKVHLVRTGYENGLSAPIDFKSLDSDIILSQSEDGNMVTVYLQSAIKFVMELEEKEMRACLHLYDDVEAQEKLAAERWKHLLEDGYKREQPKGPRSTWIKLSVGEEPVVAITASSQMYTKRLREDPAVRKFKLAV